MANIQSSLIRLKTLINALKDKWQQITGIATTSFQQFIASIASYKQGNIDKALNAINSTDKGSFVSIIETSARASAIATQPFTNNADIMWVQEFVHTTNNWNNFFNKCYKLKYIEGTYDLSNATSCIGLFNYCYSLIELPQLTLPISVTSFYVTFGQCMSLKIIPETLTINANNLNNTFNRCRNLERVKCTINSNTCANFLGMFYDCRSLIEIPAFDTSSGTSFSTMFWYCQSLQTVPQLDTSNGIAFDSMFYLCHSIITTADKPITLNLQNVAIWYQLVGTTQNSNVNNIFNSAPHINHVAFSGVYDKIASDVDLTVFGFTYLNEDSIVSLFKCFRPVDVEQGYTMTLNATQKAWEITLTAAEALERFEDEEMAGTYTLEDYSGLLGFDISA